MKDSARYNKLWQQKMLELPVGGDGDAAWEKMQGLLDEHLPVNSPVVITKPRASWVPVLTALVAAVIIAAMLYFAGIHFFTGHHRQPVKQISKHSIAKSDSAESNRLNKNEERGLADNSDVNKLNTTTAGPLAAVHSNAASPAANSAGNTKTGADVKPGNAAVNGATVANNAANSGSGENKTRLANEHKPVAWEHRLNPSVTLTNTSQGQTGSRQVLNHTGHHLPATGSIANSSTTQKANLSLLNKAGHHQHSLGSTKKGLSTRGDNPSASNQSRNTRQSKTGYKNASDSLNALSVSKGNNPPTLPRPGQTPGVNIAADSAALSANHKTGLKKSLTDSATVKNKAEKSAKAKPAGNKKTGGNSRFELGVKIGVNTGGSFTASGQNANFYGKSAVDAFFGIAATYYISSKLGVGIGVNGLSPKMISGSYTKSNLTYTTQPDTGKAISHSTGKVTIAGSRKMYSVDIPVLVNYKINNFVSFTAGPVISIPIKQEAMKSNLSLLTNNKDTTTLKHLTPYVNSTTISNKTSFSFSAGVKLNYNRLFLDASYMRNLTPYTISSGLGSNHAYYQAVQFGIGFYLFKPKK